MEQVSQRILFRGAVRSVDVYRTECHAWQQCLIGAALTAMQQCWSERRLTLRHDSEQDIAEMCYLELQQRNAAERTLNGRNIALGLLPLAHASPVTTWRSAGIAYGIYKP